MSKRIKLRGGLHNTSSSIEIQPDGKLVIEFYDFSDEAERYFGNDVAYILTVDAALKTYLISQLIDEKKIDRKECSEDELLLQLIEVHFENYFEIKEWLELKKIAYVESFDSWA